MERWDYRSRAFLLGLTFSPEWHPAHASVWAVSLAPAFSSVSFHANYRAQPTGWELSLRRQLGQHFHVEFGRLETGAGTDRPRYADGRFLETPPYDEQREEWAQLEVKTGVTYLLVGAEHAWGERGRLGVATGAGHADASFRSVFSPVPFSGAARFYDQVDRVAFIAQARADWHLGRGWHAGVTVRYTDFEGVQITSPLFEPDFGNTKVRLWSLLPRESLVF